MDTPKGKIVAIGGHEDKGLPMPGQPFLPHESHFFKDGILKRIHDELYGLGTRVEVVTTATAEPEKLGPAYVNAFMELGCDNVGILQIQEKDDVTKPEYLERLKKAEAVMFTGGDQRRIAEVFQGSEALQILHSRYFSEEKFLISGTSAGAMALGRIMIQGSDGHERLVKGNIQLGQGLNLLPEIIIDTHFINRRRFSRLIETMAAYPQQIAIGLGEDTGILISKGDCIETIGSGLVVIFDGRKLLENNYPELEEGQPLCLENVVMHILPRGKAYWVTSGKLGMP